jgi:hypothetical protein
LYRPNTFGILGKEKLVFFCSRFKEMPFRTRSAALGAGFNAESRISDKPGFLP